MRKKKAVKRARRAVKAVGRDAEAHGRPEESGDEAPWVGAVPCPVPRDPAMGDKTPEVMAWYREYLPEEYRRRYGNRVCPVVGEAVMRRGVLGALDDAEERGPVSDFEDEEEDAQVVVKPRVIMG